MLIVGHTHNEMDQLFSNIRAQVYRQPAYTLDEYTKMIESSYSKLAAAGSLQSVHLVDVWDWDSFFEGHLNNFENISKPHGFLFHYATQNDKRYVVASSREYFHTGDWIQTGPVFCSPPGSFPVNFRHRACATIPRQLALRISGQLLRELGDHPSVDWWRSLAIADELEKTLGFDKALPPFHSRQDMFPRDWFRRVRAPGVIHYVTPTQQADLAFKVTPSKKWPRMGEPDKNDILVLADRKLVLYEGTIGEGENKRLVVSSLYERKERDGKIIYKPVAPSERTFASVRPSDVLDRGKDVINKTSGTYSVRSSKRIENFWQDYTHTVEYQRVSATRNTRPRR
jgi:hypothetical protein